MLAVMAAVLINIMQTSAGADGATSGPLPAHWTVYPYPPRGPTDGIPSSITESSSLRFFNHFLHGGNRSWSRDGHSSLRILVAGAGTGDATLEFAAQISQANGGCGLRGAQVVHFEQSVASAKLARQRVEHFGLEQWVTFVVGDLRAATELLGGFGRFDIINFVGVLHHIPEPSQLPVLRKLSSLLRDDGGMLLMVYGKHGRNGVDSRCRPWC